MTIDCVINNFGIMIINILRSTSVFFSFCLFSFLLLTLTYVNGQNDNLPVPQQQQQPNSKVNSININNRSVTNGNNKPEAATTSDNVVIKKKYSNLNSKYETQSTVTSTTSVGLFPGPKKSEYLLEFKY